MPTRNEAPNVEPLAHRLGAVLGSRPGGWELVFVDDSDDSTPQLVRGLVDVGLPVRLLHREKADRQGGLGGAVQEGFAMARGYVVAVMDADLQHPPEALPALVSPVLLGDAALVAGSRYGWAGGDSGLSGPWRHFVSGTCRGLVHLLVPASRPLQDPLSGFFALRRSLLDGVQLQPAGYKILLEVVVRAKPAPVANVGFDFAPRHAGRSKADLHEGLMFLRHLSRLVVISWRSRRGNGLAAASAASGADPADGGGNQVQPPSA